MRPRCCRSTRRTRSSSSTCATCHDNDAKTGGLTLEDFDAATIDQHAEIAEKMIRKLRAGMMPPPTVKDRPDPATLAAFATALETKIDTAAALHPNPGRRTFQRLNRAEYARAVRDLLDIDVDVNAFLPPDTMSHGFDNIADVQSFSPTLMEGYLRAASKIASIAVGDRTASPTEATVKVPRTESQMEHVDGTPWGTRGGVSVVHNFPADGDYTFRILLHSVPTGQLYGSTSRGEQIEISINGERVALLDINYRMSETDKNGLNLTTPRIHVNAGPAARVGRVHPEIRGADRRSDGADRLHARRQPDRRRVRHHDAAAPARLQHHRSVQGHRRLGHAEPPQDLRLPADHAPAEEAPCARRF